MVFSNGDISFLCTDRFEKLQDSCGTNLMYTIFYVDSSILMQKEDACNNVVLAHMGYL